MIVQPLFYIDDIVQFSFDIGQLIHIMFFQIEASLFQRIRRPPEGLMDAAAKGALQAEKPASRFKIGKEADEFSSIPTLGNLAYLQVR
ncbi:hypothetical protein RHGRI_007316 [Rhododendron griersonianum]|uniref:Uncharacterized protein n=1 Tax=Rhododendron griersonianum TaxID=479676 RepID=A0AAV6KWE1_9ERIC|nr:hypothetical protein RHGRI_007316 [Rhododendron griersonianum]